MKFMVHLLRRYKRRLLIRSHVKSLEKDIFYLKIEGESFKNTIDRKITIKTTLIKSIQKDCDHVFPKNRHNHYGKCKYCGASYY